MKQLATVRLRVVRPPFATPRTAPVTALVVLDPLSRALAMAFRVTIRLTLVTALFTLSAKVSSTLLTPTLEMTVKAVEAVTSVKNGRTPSPMAKSIRIRMVIIRLTTINVAESTVPLLLHPTAPMRHLP